VATSRGKYVERLLGAPNDERTRLGSNKLWQIELLELWLRTRGTRFPAQMALSTGNGRGTFSRASRSTQGFSARKRGAYEEAKISTTRLTVSGLRVRAVHVPVEPPLETASAEIRSAPLVLVDLLTEEGVTGHSYVFCVTPLALAPLARLVSNLEPLIEGDAVAPLEIEQKLQGRFRLLGPQGA
jgi:hypothetical protein